MINEMRTQEIAEKALDRIVGYDPDLAAEIIFDDLDMTDEELDYFGINKADLE